MILRRNPLIATLPLLNLVAADIAPEITWVLTGYNFIAKLPCQACPFLYQDTSKGEAEPWTARQDTNALLLNISIPYTNPSISLNQAKIYPPPSKLPRIYADQVVQDISPTELDTALSLHQQDPNHEISSHAGPGGFFGLSYRQSLRRIPKSAALVFHFDIVELYSDLPERPLSHRLDDPEQKMLEMVLLQRPVMSALETVGFEIVRAALVERGRFPREKSEQYVMRFLDWDAYGQVGTPSHLLTSWGAAFLGFLDSGIWAVFAFLMGVILLFVVVCLVCIFFCGCCSDEYEQAQHGKAKGDGRRHGDVEMGTRRFMRPEELGLLGRGGRVVGIGKSD